jgi:purine-binding chemotaxis protein CheW
MEKRTMLTFLLGNEYFAVEVTHVLEVLEKQHITKVPHAPLHILGITNFRGEILPVVNMRLKFNLPSLTDEAKNYIIIYDISNKDKSYTIAATADSVNDVIEISDDEIKPVPELGINYNSKFISGAIRRNEHFILILNIDKILLTAETETVEKISLSTAV